jgi:hypothetical protein
MTCRAFIPYECQPHDRAAFEGQIIALPFAGLSLVISSNNGVTTWRPTLRTTQAKDTVYVCIQTAGTVRISQNGNDAVLQNGDFALVDNVTANAFVSSDGSKNLVIELSRKDLEARLGRIEQWTARRVDGSIGVGALASKFVRMLPEQQPNLSEAAQTQIALLGAVCLAFAPKGCGGCQSDEWLCDVRGTCSGSRHLRPICQSAA